MRLFSQKPSKGIKFFRDNNLLEDTLEATAKFLHDESDRLDKTAIGMLLIFDNLSIHLPLSTKQFCEI